MARNAAAPVGQMPAKRLCFDRYVLDLDRGCLFLDGNELALRPKTFAVLAYLVENAGRLVSKDDLFAAVWPNVAISDDGLVQSVGELRRALGEDGPRLIRTVPRRGYRLEAAVSVVAPTDPASVDGTPDTATADGAHSPAPVVLPGPSSLPRPSIAGRGSGLLIASALVLLLAAGLLWTGLGSESKFLAALRSGNHLEKSGEVGTRPAIAVLPFRNQGEDASRDYLAEGLTQDIIGALGRFSELTVMSWNAVLPYRTNPRSPGEIARSLGVRYQVEGAVHPVGDRVRIGAQLVDADGRVLWSARFDEALADLSGFQHKITSQIAGALAVRVARVEQRQAFAKPANALEAYDYVMRARPALQRPTRANNAEARAFLKRAVEIDPNFATAYAALAESYYVAVSMGWAESPTEFLSRAEDMAHKALNLDDSEVRARIVLGRIHIFRRRYEQAKTELEHALAINPSDAGGLAGHGNVLMWLGDTDAAIRALELAQRIDPELNTIDRFALGLAYYLKGRYEAAIEQAVLNLRKANGASFSSIVLAASYAQLNRREDAARVADMIRRTDPTFDPQAFGRKFLKPQDLERLRDGLRKAGLDNAEPGPAASAN